MYMLTMMDEQCKKLLIGECLLESIGVKSRLANKGISIEGFLEIMLRDFSQRKYTFYHQKTLLDAFQTNSNNNIDRKPSMVIPLLANQDLMPTMLDTYFGPSRYKVG